MLAESSLHGRLEELTVNYLTGKITLDQYRNDPLHKQRAAALSKTLNSLANRHDSKGREISKPARNFEEVCRGLEETTIEYLEGRMSLDEYNTSPFKDEYSYYLGQALHALARRRS